MKSHVLEQEPTMPPAPGLGPVVAVWGTSMKGFLAPLVIALTATAALCGAIMAGVPLGPDVFLATIALLCYAFALSTRRMYWAIGTDWIYVRNFMFKPGRWAPMADITSVSIVHSSNTTYLRVIAGQTKIFDARPGARWASKSPFFPALGRALLQLPLSLDDPTRTALKQWADFSPSMPTRGPN